MTWVFIGAAAAIVVVGILALAGLTAKKARDASGGDVGPTYYGDAGSGSRDRAQDSSDDGGGSSDGGGGGGGK